MSDFIKRLYKNRENIAETKKILENIIKVEGLENLGIDFIEKNKLNENYILALADIKQNKISNEYLDKNISFKKLDDNSVNSIAKSIESSSEKGIKEDEFKKTLDVFFKKTPVLKEFNQINLEVYKNCEEFSYFLTKLNIDLGDLKSNNNINSEFKITNKNNKLNFCLKTTGTSEKDNLEITSDSIVDFRNKIDVLLEKYPLDEISQFFSTISKPKDEQYLEHIKIRNDKDFEVIVNNKYGNIETYILKVDYDKDKKYLEHIKIRKDKDFEIVINNKYGNIGTYILKVDYDNEKQYITRGYLNEGIDIDKLVNTLTVENYLESYQNDSFEKKYLTKKINNLEKEAHIMRDELRERVKKESFEDVKNDLLAYSFKKANPITKKEVSKILDDEYSKKFQHYTNEEAEAYLLERKDEFSFTITDDGKIKELMNYYYDNMYDKTQLYEDYYNTCKKFLKYGIRMNINDIILNENFDFYDGSTLKEKYGKKETGTVELENEFRKSVFILTLTEYDKESFENEISKGKTPLRISENNAIFNLIFLNKVNEKLENEFAYPKINEIEMKKEVININFNEYNEFLERDFVRRSILENKNKSNYIEEEPMKNVIVKFGDMEIKI